MSRNGRGGGCSCRFPLFYSENTKEKDHEIKWGVSNLGDMNLTWVMFQQQQKTKARQCMLNTTGLNLLLWVTLASKKWFYGCTLL